MTIGKNLEHFVTTAQAAGCTVATAASAAEIASYIAPRLQGTLLLPEFRSDSQTGLAEALRTAGCTVVENDFRMHAPAAEAGLTGCDFAIAETGTVVLESTPEEIRLASTLPEKHFVLLDPRNIIADALEAIPLLRRLQLEQPSSYLAYITGPSRTADIERVLTIGVHGPKELHILLCENLAGGTLDHDGGTP